MVKSYFGESLIRKNRRDFMRAQVRRGQWAGLARPIAVNQPLAVSLTPLVKA